MFGLSAAAAAAVATVGGSIIGGYLQSDAIGDASDAQAGAARDANALQKYMYDTTREDNAPWRAAGQTALDKLNNLLSSGQITSKFTGQDFMNDPGYKFGLEQGQRAIDNSASARGGIGSAALKAGARYAQDYAGTKYNEAFNRFQTERQNMLDPLYRMAGYGSAANTQNQLAGTNYANNAGNNMLGAANANAAAGIAQGNIWGNVLNEGIAVGNKNNWWQTPPIYDYDYRGTELPGELRGGG